MQNEEHIICVNDEIGVDQVMEERENQSLQTDQENVIKLIKKRLSKFCNNCKFKLKNGILTIERHFFGIFLMCK